MISATNTEKNIQELFRRSRQQEEESQLNQKMEETVANAQTPDMAGADTLMKQDAQRKQALDMVDAGLGDASVDGPPAPMMRQSGEGLANPMVPVDQEGNRLPQTSPASTRTNTKEALNSVMSNASTIAGNVKDAVGFMSGKISDATSRATELAGKVAGSQAVTDLVDSAADYVEKGTGTDPREELVDPNERIPDPKTGSEFNMQTRAQHAENDEKKRKRLRQENKTNRNLREGAMADPAKPTQLLSSEEMDEQTGLIYDYLVRTRGPGFQKIFKDVDDFRNRMSEVGFETSDDITSFLQATGLKRLGPNESPWNGTGMEPPEGSPKGPTGNLMNLRKGDVVTKQDMDLLGDVKAPENDPRPDYMNTRRRVSQNQRQRGDASNDVSLEGSPDAFRQNPDVVNVKGNLVYDASEKGPKRRTYGGIAEKIMQNQLLKLYQEPGKNHRDIVDITRHLAHSLGIPASQFPDEEADAMLAKEVLNHISRFGGAEDRSIAKMLAEGDNPWYKPEGSDDWVAAVPRDGRDGVAQTGNKPIAEQVYNPMTGNFEVRRPAERREADNRRAGKTFLVDQLEAGNFPVETYIDEEGNWLDLGNGRTGRDQFIQDYAEEIGIGYMKDPETGELLLDDKGNPQVDFSTYTGRGAGRGAAGFRAEIAYFHDLLNRNQNLQRQNQMRGQQQNEMSPTLGPQIMNDSLAQATTDAERFEIAARFNNIPLMKFYREQLRNKNEVDVAAAGAGAGDGDASRLMAETNAGIANDVAAGDVNAANTKASMLVPDGDPIQAAAYTAGMSVKQGQYPYSIAENPFIRDLAYKVGDTMKPWFENKPSEWSPVTTNDMAWAFGMNTYEDLANQFADKMARLVPGAPEGFLDENRVWFHQNILKTQGEKPAETQVGEPEVRGGGDGKTEPKGGVSSSSKSPFDRKKPNPRANATANKNTP